MTEQMQKPRIWVDFQNSDPKGRVRLTSVGTVQELSRLGLILQEGLEVTLYCYEFEGDGIVTYSEDERRWVAKVDWENIRSREADAGKHRG